jgi:hypothetical protein
MQWVCTGPAYKRRSVHDTVVNCVFQTRFVSTGVAATSRQHTWQFAINFVLHFLLVRGVLHDAHDASVSRSHGSKRTQQRHTNQTLPASRTQTHEYAEQFEYSACALCNVQRTSPFFSGSPSLDQRQRRWRSLISVQPFFLRPALTI